MAELEETFARALDCCNDNRRKICCNCTYVHNIAYQFDMSEAFSRLLRGLVLKI